MYTLYTLVLTTAKARMFSDQVVNTWSFGFQWQIPYFCWDIKQKIVTNFQWKPSCPDLQHLWHRWEWDCRLQGVYDGDGDHSTYSLSSIIQTNVHIHWRRTRKKPYLMDPSLIIFYPCQLLNDLPMLSRLEWSDSSWSRYQINDGWRHESIWEKPSIQ